MSTARVHDLQPGDPIPLALVAGARQPRIEIRDVDWPTFRDKMQRPRRIKGDKLEAPGWLPVIMRPGRPLLRAARNIAGLWAFVVDLDDGRPVYECAEAVSATGHCAIIHTTWSHDPDHHKARAIFPLDTICPVERWAAVWRSAAVWARCLGLELDPACKDPSRFYFLPALPAGDWVRRCGIFWAESYDGDPLSWEWLLQAYPAPAPTWRPLPMASAGRGSAALDHEQSGRRAFALRLVERRAQQIVAQGEGGRNRRLYAAGWAVAQLNTSGVLDLEWAAAELMEAAKRAGLEFKEADRALRNGIARGATKGPWPWT